MNIENIIFKDLTSISEKATIDKLLHLMLHNRMQAVPVVDKFNTYLGCIGEADILDACLPPYMKTMENTSFLPDIGVVTESLKKTVNKKIIDILPKDYPTVKPKDSITYAADLMNKHSRHILPVIDNGKLVGRVNKLDLLSVAIK